MPRKSEPRLYVATETASVPDPDEGTPVTLIAGHTIIDENDPLYRKFPDLFGPVQPRSYRRVEQATAAPGEKR